MRRSVLPALLLCGCLFDPYRELTEFEQDAPTAEQCGACHVAIYEEFRVSAHASAWTDPVFAEATAEHRFRDCLGCHAPESVYIEGDPATRDSHPEEGVTCISCHFDGRVLAGPAPASALVEPHPIAEQREIYLRSELCGKCHQGTFAEWQAANLEGKRTCQECHMPEVTRKLTQPTGLLSALLVAFEEPHVGRQHTFQLEVLAGFEGALEVRIENLRRNSASVRLDLVLTNQLPHLIPTGDFGFRRASVRLQGRDARGTASVSREFELFKELDRALAPLEPRTFPLEFPAGTRSLDLSVLASKADGPQRTIYTGSFELP